MVSLCAVLLGFLLVFVLPASGVVAQPSRYPKRISLDGPWGYRPLAHTTLKPDGSFVDVTSELPASGTMPVPSNWNLQRLPNFNGRVRFERDFDFAEPISSSDRVLLVFHGVDYFAHVELNGAVVGHHEGYFQTFEFDVTPEIRRGRNHIVVTVDAPMEEVGSVWPDHKRLIKGILSHWDCKPGSVSKESGQDGTSAGIWNSVHLEIRHVAWLGNVKIQPFLYERKLATGNSEDEGYDAKVFITAEVHAVRPGQYSLAAEVGGVKVSSNLNLTSPDATVVLLLPMEHPHLWWTWDLGEPFLYTCHLALAAGGETVYARDVNFGVRSIALDEKTGAWCLNGVRFFIRGTNIVPEMWLSRYTPERIAQDIKLLRDAHINGVRVCVHVNREELYEALDRAGIVAWQDFPLQWDYIHSDTFLEEAARQLRDMIRQFYNHPSIITWVCQNESTAYNVRVIDPFLARVGAQEDSSRPVRPVAAFDEHLYAGWYDGDFHDYLKLPGGPIISELGAQALPSVEEVREMTGSEWPPDWKQLAYHDFQYDQTFHVARVPLGRDWEEFVANSQRYQADVLKFAVEHYRRAKYAKIGSFFQFQFVDCWPSVTWSVVSYDRKPKLGYFALQRAYQPVLVGADLDRVVFGRRGNRSDEPPGVHVSPWAVNDQHRIIEDVTYEARLQGPGGTAVIGTGRASAPLAADSVTTLPGVDCQAPPKLPPGRYDLVLTLKEGSRTLSENFYEVTVTD
jgi:beta-mannosidase